MHHTLVNQDDVTEIQLLSYCGTRLERKGWRGRRLFTALEFREMYLHSLKIILSWQLVTKDPCYMLGNIVQVFLLCTTALLRRLLEMLGCCFRAGHVVSALANFATVSRMVNRFMRAGAISHRQYLN